MNNENSINKLIGKFIKNCEFFEKLNQILNCSLILNEEFNDRTVNH